MSMVDVMSTALIIGLFGAFVVTTILALKYWSELLSLKSDTARYVTLRDLDGHSKKIGKYNGLGTKDENFTTKVRKKDDAGKEVIEEWVINLGTRYNYEGIKKDYDEEVMVLTDFYKSNWERREIEPLCDLEILKLELTKSVRALSAGRIHSMSRSIH